MIETASATLTPWDNFYIMLGSAAAALTGLMFVVITLVTSWERPGRSHAGISTFSTPTVVHFGAALLMSAVLSAPWPTLLGPAVTLGIVGLGGVVYIARVWSGAKTFTEYDPDTEDGIFYTLLPLLAYLSIFAGALTLPARPAGAMFVLAAGIALLIFIGIRNSWDIVTYIVITSNDPADK